MIIKEISQADIEEVKELQPEGWPDISIEFKQYLNKDFCYPIKVIIANNIVGLGSSIVFEKTGWLAHIIVKTEYRNRGIGFEIVKYLIAELKSKQVKTYLLIATDLGEPVYKKFGFKTISDYLFLKRENIVNSNVVISDNIKAYEDKLYDMVLELDSSISGENREQLIKCNLKNAFVYQDKDKLNGVYLPDLGEGLIIADTNKAGLELMNLKYSKINKAVIPAENKVGLDFLIKNGFKLSDSKGRKMILGNEISWKADCYFSRIGGNYG